MFDRIYKNYYKPLRSEVGGEIRDYIRCPKGCQTQHRRQAADERGAEGVFDAKVKEARDARTKHRLAMMGNCDAVTL